MSNSAKQHPIKAIMNFRTLTADAVVTAAVNIAGTAYNNTKFAGASPQPVDQPTLKAATDALVAANAAAVDGGKKAVQEQKHLKEVVVKFLIQLAHWAEANCKEKRVSAAKAFRGSTATPRDNNNVATSNFLVHLASTAPLCSYVFFSDRVISPPVLMMRLSGSHAPGALPYRSPASSSCTFIHRCEMRGKNTTSRRS